MTYHRRFVRVILSNFDIQLKIPSFIRCSADSLDIPLKNWLLKVINLLLGHLQVQKIIACHYQSHCVVFMFLQVVITKFALNSSFDRHSL